MLGCNYLHHRALKSTIFMPVPESQFVTSLELRGSPCDYVWRGFGYLSTNRSKHYKYIQEHSTYSTTVYNNTKSKILQFIFGLKQHIRNHLINFKPHQGLDHLIILFSNPFMQWKTHCSISSTLRSTYAFGQVFFSTNFHTFKASLCDKQIKQ